MDTTLQLVQAGHKHKIQTVLILGEIVITTITMEIITLDIITIKELGKLAMVKASIDDATNKVIGNKKAFKLLIYE